MENNDTQEEATPSDNHLLFGVSNTERTFAENKSNLMASVAPTPAIIAPAKSKPSRKEYNPLDLFQYGANAAIDSNDKVSVDHIPCGICF